LDKILFTTRPRPITFFSPLLCPTTPHSNHKISIADDLIPTTLATTTTKMALSCTVCEKGDTESAPLKKCGKCKEIYYCSAECQKQDWPAHRRYCGKAWWDNEKMRKCEDNSLHEGYLTFHFHCFLSENQADKQTASSSL